jgi:hypothetical protein
VKKLLFLLGVLLFFSACGKSEETEIEDYTIALTEEAEADPSESAAINTDPSMRIIWGWGHLTNGLEIDLTDAAIPHYFNEKYGVRIDMLVVAPEADPSEVSADFYVTHAPVAWEKGVIRPISFEMLEKYAPHYAQLLKTEPYLVDLNKIPGGEDYMGLTLFNGEAHALNEFSVYRMDWLEEAGIPIFGNVTEIFDRVYFTDQGISEDQFREIANVFLIREGPRGFFLPEEVYGLNSFIAPLAGMFGLNMTSWFDGAETAPIASNAYREFLHYLRHFYRNELVESGPISGEGQALDAFLHAPIFGRVGWWTAQLQAISYYRAKDSQGYVLTEDANAKLLIAPPERSNNGNQGVGVSTVLPVFYGNHLQWVINANVSDEKLAVILQIFDGFIL